MKKRTILIVIIVVVLGAISVAAYWYVRSNTGPRLLNRAHLAMKAQNFKKAADLAAEYVAEEPGDWNGHQTLGLARLHMGLYLEARKAFEAAMKVAPAKEPAPLLSLADTYSLPARRTLGRAQGIGGSDAKPLDIEQFTEAIEQLDKANRSLEGLEIDDKRALLDAKQHIGLNHMATALAWRQRRLRIDQEEKIARKAGDTATADRKAVYREGAQASADKASVEAIKVLLVVVRKDPTRSAAAQGLVEVCTAWDNKEYMGKVTEVVMGSRGTLPLAAMRLAYHHLRSRVADEPTEQRRRRWREFGRVVNGLLADYPDDVEMQLASATVAMELGDIKAARATCSGILARHKGHDEGRLLLARIILAEEGLKTRAEQRDYSQAIVILRDLTYANPGWDEAHYHYGLANNASGVAASEVLDALNAFDTLKKLKGQLEATGDVLTKAERAELEGRIGALQARCDKEELVDRYKKLDAQRDGLESRRNILKSTAQRAMRRAVEINPRHFAARTFLVLSLGGEGFGQQALHDASEYHKQDPANGAAIRLYFDTAVRSDQPELARSILAGVPHSIDDAIARIKNLQDDIPKRRAAEEQAAAAVKAAKQGGTQKARYDAQQKLKAAKLDLGKAKVNLSEAQRDLERFRDPRLLRVVAEGYLLLRRRHLAAAEKELDDARKADPPREPDKLFVSRQQSQAKDMQNGAIDALTRAAKCTATTAAGHLAVARALIEIEQGTKAAKILEDGLKKNDDQPELHYMLGQVYRQNGQMLQAIERFEAAVRLDSEDTRYGLALARALFDSGDLSSAQGVLESLDASDVDSRLLRLEIALARGESASARDVLEQFSGDERVNRARALMHYDNGELSKCIDVCTRELESNPVDYPLRMLRAQAYNQVGRKDDCRKELETVLQAMPDQISIYYRYAGVLASEMPLPEVEKALTRLPRAKAELVDLTMAWLMEQAGDFKSAVTVYQRVLGRDDVPAFYRNRTRLLKARALGRMGQVDQALGELDALAGEDRWDRAAVAGKVEALMRAGRNDEALAALGQLREILTKARNAPGLLRLVRTYLRLQGSDEALAICEQIKKLKPNDTSPYMLQAEVLRVVGKREGALSAVTEASKLRPADMEIQLALARELDALNRPRQALDVLARLDRTGPDGKVRALYGRARLLTQWGLAAPAADAFERLGRLGHESSPDIQVSLGLALAQLGRAEDARKRLESVTIHAPQYVAARLILARIASSPVDKLNILTALDIDKPGRSDVLAQRMGVLMGEKKHGEALEAFSVFMRRKKINETSQLRRVSFLALTCVIETGLAKAASDFAGRNARQSGSPYWRRVAVLLGIDADPDGASKLLEGVERMDLNDVYLGIALAASRQDELAVRTWMDRADRLTEAMAAANPPQRIYPRYLLLSALAAGQIDKARKALAAFSSSTGIDRAAAEELVANTPDDAGARAEAIVLLKATLAVDFGLGDLGRKWAAAAMSSRPRCQWAAILAFRTDPGPEACRKFLDALHPKDCTAALTMKAYILGHEHKYAEAADVYRALAEKHPDSTQMALDHAAAVEKAGRLEEALVLYQKVQARESHPLAANNGAYLMTQLHPTDVKRVTEAYKWMDETVKSHPRMSAFRETRGYLAFLLGKGDQARADIREAIKGLTESPDAHYHLGLVESDAGDLEMARWHFEASVSSCRAIEDRGDEPTAAESNAARLAAKALVAVRGKEQTSRPSHTAPAGAAAGGGGAK